MTVDGEFVSDSDTITLTEGDTANLAVSLKGESVLTEANVTVTDSSVVSVHSGVITAAGVGSSTVVLTYQDGNISYTYCINFIVREAVISLLENGESEYSIVVPHETYQYWSANANSASRIAQKPLAVAATELQFWFNEATGVSLNIVSDSNVTSGQKYISLGNTALYLSSGAMLTDEERAQISLDGSKIFNIDNNVYLIGGTDKGTCFAVYEWMDDLFDYDYFARDTWYIDDSIKQSEPTERNLRIADMSKLVLPSVATRGVSIGGPENATKYLAGAAYSNSTTGISVSEYAYAGDYATFVYKYRARISDGIFFPIHTQIGNAASTNTTIHNSYEFLSSSNSDLNALKAGNVPSGLDENWIGENNDSYFDICYSAHGVESSYNALVAHFANKILYSLQTYTEAEYPTYNTVTICMEDGWGAQYCECSACLAVKAAHGYVSYAGLKFTNDVANYLYNTLLVGNNAQYKRDDFHLLYMAYGSEMNKAPTNVDFTLHDCVGVYYAVQDFSYFNDIDSEVNASTKAHALAWSNLVKDKGGMALWTYSTDFWHYLYYFDSISFFETKAYDFFANTCDVYYWRNQNQTQQYGVSSAFSNLQAYLDYKLMWNCDLDSEQLIVKWFQNKFGDAWDEMFAVFNQMRADFREAVVPNAIYDEEASSNGFRDYNIVGSADEITMGVSAHPNNPFTLYEHNLPFSYSENATYSVETTMDWLQMFDAAYAALGDDCSVYQRKAVDAEWLAAAYAVLNRANASLQSTVYSTDGNKSVVLSDLKAQFKATAYAVRLVSYKQSSSIFTYNTFAENELFFEVLGYRGILTSLKDLCGIMASVNDGIYLKLSSIAPELGDTILLEEYPSGTTCNFENVVFTFENNVGDNGNAIFTLSSGTVYTATDSGTVTVIMTYTVDGVSYTTTETVTVSAT